MQFKKICFLLLIASGLFRGSSAWAFSLLGPYEEWQTPQLNYRQPGDIGGWMGRDEEYRWNVPYITYGFDSSFISYFGTNGINAVEEAIAILNALPPASQLDVESYPMVAHGINPQAQALQLADVKSVALTLLLEEMGLADPYTGVWRLRDRVTGTGFTNYYVIQRNYDPLTYIPTNAINGILFTYNTIVDIQDAGPPTGAYPLVTTLDTTDNPPYTAAASSSSVRPGVFFTGLTRDDVGALKYLFDTNNYNVERLLPDVRVVHTNVSSNALLFTIDLTTFHEQALTNSPDSLLGIYTNLLILTNWVSYTNVVTSNFVAYLTNSEWNPALSFDVDYMWFFETNVATNYHYVFGNVVTNFGGPVESNATILVEETIVAPNPFDPAGSPFATNFVRTIITTNVPVGTVYIINQDLLDYHFAGLQLEYVTSITNTSEYINVAPGAIPQTNTISYIRNATNYIYRVNPIELLSPTNSIGLRPGVDKVTFKRVHYDSYIGTQFLSITNRYIDTVIVSNEVVHQTVIRTSTRPDIIFSAPDIGGLMPWASRTDTGNWINNSDVHNSTNSPGTMGGPGIIYPAISINFNKNFPMYFNFRQGAFNQFLNHVDLGYLLNDNQPITAAFGTFNGTTNPPIVYPIGGNIHELEHYVLGR